jgi:Uncharacterized protein conserved in bacteria
MKIDGLSPPTQLQNFQDHYSRYLRAPFENTLVTDIPARRSQVYEELLFNNVCGFLDRCFPVARSLLDENTWRQLNRNFYRDWQCHTPYFSRIPREFVQYMENTPTPEVGEWFSELLDYEWRELEADTHPAEVPHIQTPNGNDCFLRVNPTLQNLQYQWPVHQISNSFIPTEAKPTFLLAYRRWDHRVEFMEINAMTAALLQILQQAPADPDTVIATLAELLPEANHQVLRDFGKPLLLDLLQKNVVVLA